MTPRVVFSRCGRYRYWLEWATGLDDTRAMLFVGANPSRAGTVGPHQQVLSDPTVSRVRNLARELGYGRLWVVNCRSYVSTDPDGVPPDPEGIGVHTDDWIRASVRHADLIVCAWGHLAGERGAVVLEMVRQAGNVPHALALTKSGIPRHPRGVPKSAGLVEL